MYCRACWVESLKGSVHVSIQTASCRACKGFGWLALLSFLGMGWLELAVFFSLSGLQVSEFDAERRLGEMNRWSNGWNTSWGESF